MNKTNIKHGYNLMFRDARGAIWNPGAQTANFKSRGRIHATRGAILKSGAQHWHGWKKPRIKTHTLLSNTALSTGMSGVHVQLCLFNYT